MGVGKMWATLKRVQLQTLSLCTFQVLCNLLNIDSCSIMRQKRTIDRADQMFSKAYSVNVQRTFGAIFDIHHSIENTIDL